LEPIDPSDIALYGALIVGGAGYFGLKLVSWKPVVGCAAFFFIWVFLIELLTRMREGRSRWVRSAKVGLLWMLFGAPAICLGIFLFWLLPVAVLSRWKVGLIGAVLGAVGGYVAGGLAARVQLAWRRRAHGRRAA
jgi:hypothetical protein